MLVRKVITNTVSEHCELVEIANDDQADLLLLHVNITPVGTLCCGCVFGVFRLLSNETGELLAMGQRVWLFKSKGP